jgi:holliday junction DNA helicase RuvA
MIEYLQGRLVSKEAVTIVVDVHGIGYSVNISLSTFEALPAEGEEVRILTHLHVREDAMQLFGFSGAEERALFRQLQTISGIGARTALTILSGINPAELRGRVLSGDVPALQRIPGIGRKTAERIIVELRDTFSRSAPVSEIGAPSASASMRDEALLALQALGYPRQAAEKAVAELLRGGEIPSTAALVKQALKILNA